MENSFPVPCPYIKKKLKKFKKIKLLYPIIRVELQGQRVKAYSI